MSVAIFGESSPFYLIVALWILRVVLWAFLSALLAWLGVVVLDALTPRIHQRDRVGQSPTSVGLFIAGFLILIGLVIHGVVTGPVLVGAGLWHSVLDPRRLGLVALSFLASLLVGVVLLHIVDKLTPRIPFGSVDREPIAAGIYVFGYLVFFGLIIHAALVMPL